MQAVAAHRRLTRRFRILLAAVLVASALMPFVPDKPSIETGAFLLLLAVFLPVALRERLRGPRPPRQPAGIALAAFCASIAVSLPVALSRGVPAGEWLRGAVPFVFLAVYAVFPALSERDGAFVVRCVLLATACWLIKALATALPSFIAGGQDRLTYASPDFQLPMTLAALPLLLFWAVKRRPLGACAAMAVLALIVIGTGYRSQALLMGALWVLFVVTRRPLLRVKLALASAALVAVAGSVFVTSSFGETWLARFQGVESELQSQRAVEALYGLHHFQEAPLLGNGLGFPVPLAVNRFGASEPAPLDSDHVGYIHDAWIYFAMDLGVVGLAAYVAFFACALFAARRSTSDAIRAVAVSVITLLAYFSVEAAFREIQMNFLLGILTAVLAKSERA